ncbi:MAG: hypothetical protein RSC10_09895 [Longicatena sp.]
MKKLLKIASALFLLVNSFSFAQTYKNDNAKELLQETSDRKKVIKLYCVTYSCCGVGPFGIEIWEHKECNYIVVSGKTVGVIDLRNLSQTPIEGSQIEVKNDITLIDKDGELEKKGLEQIMPAGTYLVVDGQVAFEPVTQRIRIKKVCLKETHQGHIFGHEYSYEINTCFYYPSWNKETKAWNGGYAVIDLNDSPELVALAQKNDNVLSFDDDTVIDGQYVLKAGKYTVEGGKIYTRNVISK